MSGDASAREDKRIERLKLLDDHIGQHLRDSEASGELRRAPSFGKPLDFGDGYDDTPAELRMPMKVLKDAGIVPPEVESMHELARLRAAAAAAQEADERRRLEQRASELQQSIALRLERLRGGAL
jgi:DNA-binding transcriptional ArsR family regulator